MIQLESEKLKFTGVEIANPQHVVIPDGVTAILGPNGAGKTSLAKIVEGGWNFMTNAISTDCTHKLRIKIIEFSDIHALTGFKSTYYQQRFESGMNDETPTVAELLGDKMHSEVWQKTADLLGLQGISQKKTNHLSSGELRKVLIANMMLDLPDVLILDNPYIGLDAQSRPILNDTIKAIASQGVMVILLLCNPNEIPDSCNAVIPMQNMTILKPVYAPFLPNQFDCLFTNKQKPQALPIGLQEHKSDDCIFDMRKCTVRYGQRTILKDIDWQVRRGECWSLSGPNGSGKTTLLSLVNADNPQAYSNDITIFGARRGSGESIWDIKKRIGYVSPEMHLYFQGYNNTLVDVVAAGMVDTVGFYTRITDEMVDKAMQWLKALGTDHLAMRRFVTLSYGQQRLGLLARAFIKNPELLILDEPLHGLDAANKHLIAQIIEEIAVQGTTLIYVTHYTPEIPPCITHHMQLIKN